MVELCESEEIGIQIHITMQKVLKINIVKKPELFLIGTYGQWIRNDSWKIDFVYGNCRKTIVCSMMEE